MAPRPDDQPIFIPGRFLYIFYVAQVSNPARAIRRIRDAFSVPLAQFRYRECRIEDGIAQVLRNLPLEDASPRRRHWWLTRRLGPRHGASPSCGRQPADRRRFHFAPVRPCSGGCRARRGPPPRPSTAGFRGRSTGWYVGPLRTSLRVTLTPLSNHEPRRFGAAVLSFTCAHCSSACPSAADLP